MADMQDVESSNIAAIGYDQDGQELHVRFIGAAQVYVYQGVPRELFNAMLCVDSKGAYLNRMIKGKFEFRMLEATEEVAKDHLTLTMTRPVFVALCQLLAGNNPLLRDDGVRVNVMVVEAERGVVTLEIAGCRATDEDEADCPFPCCASRSLATFLDL